MYVTGRDLGHFTDRYRACYMHELLPDISCMFQAIFYAWYRRIPCLVQAYSLHGTGVFYAWYRCVCTMRGTGIPMHAPCTVQAAAPFNKHTYRFCTRHTILVVKSKGIDIHY